MHVSISQDVDAQGASQAEGDRGDRASHHRTTNERTCRLLSCPLFARLVDSSDILGGKSCRTRRMFSLRNPLHVVPTNSRRSPAAMYPSIRSFFVVDVTTTTPLDLAHARSTCSGFAFRREEISLSGLSTGPPGMRVIGISGL